MKGPVAEPLFNETCCGLQSPSSARVRAAPRAPLAAGVSITSRVHVFPELRGDVQLLSEIAKSLEFAPVTEGELEKFRSCPLPLVTVTVAGWLLAPGASLPKSKDGGQKLTAVAQALRFTVVGLKKPPLDDVTVTAPRFVPPV